MHQLSLGPYKPKVVRLLYLAGKLDEQERLEVQLYQKLLSLGSNLSGVRGTLPIFDPIIKFKGWLYGIYLVV